ncbi:hypothetical protein MANES_01G239200v8 [Manihot esculenta]|nr:hypothetical protein MANES_01G239200v8 [Manihot esculenta]
MSSLEDRMPFPQMLQSVESPPFFPFREPNFQTLLKLQHLTRPWDMNTYINETKTQVQALELESCVTHDISDLHSPTKSETKGLQNPLSDSCLEDASPESNQRRANSVGKEQNSLFPWTQPQITLNETNCSKHSQIVPKERRKRKRTRKIKNKEEVETQRMTHIAVERNRRRQMNDHLNSLRSLMPSSYVERGDQASIVGGAIDFVRQLEQLLQSLEAQKRMKEREPAATPMGISSNGLFTPQAECNIQRDSGNSEEEAKVKRKSEAAVIEVTAVQNHVKLKIQCERRTGQLVRAIAALEDLSLLVLELNITSSETSVLYSFNLKIEDDCKLESADEIAATVDQIFSTTNGS